ncbi:MAG: MFS transporter [Calditrichaeota bacterium]|nr:MAG: MFS transporter [Calditrichota bacterium]MBL1204357.1 MFS transporter [Calditrichota bacterium]NOG44186.1 MFS transporter [Calditrichota bacterium]
MNNKKLKNWSWIPSLYYAEGIPYIVVMAVSVIMYKRLGISNTDIALYTSWLYLPWVIKPLWSPIVDILKTKRWWIITMQLLIGFGFAGVAFTIPVSNFFQYTLAFLWLLAFSSATHDIAADGFYMLGLSQHDQAWFVGIRSTFYRLAMITGQGLLIIFAGYIEGNTGLGEASIEVKAAPGFEYTSFVHPDSINKTDIITELNQNDVRVLISPQQLTITAAPRQKNEIDSLISFSNTWNEANGHSSAIEKTSQKAENKSPSWWQSAIVSNLESFLKTYFAPEKKIVSKDIAGNIGAVYFYLSKKPESKEEIVLNFGRDSGDKSLSLISGNRLVFNQDNWNIPAMAVIQLDPKLKEKSSAVFNAQSGNIPLAWSITFGLLSAMFILFFIYHKIILPKPKEDGGSAVINIKSILSEFFNTFILFFKKEKIGAILGFLLLYRFAESQIVKLAAPFLLDNQEAGGLALTTGEVGLVYGTVGLLSLTFGGLLGGFLAAKHGLKFWLLPMAIAINLPDLVYVYLSYSQTDSFLLINLAVAIEQFGYGFGFTAYMLYMIYASEGEHKTAHFAITTAFMALGMMIPGMFSGWLQEIIGYQHFFIWVMIATIPAILIIKLAPLDANFGKKENND